MIGTCAIHGISHKRNSQVALAELDRKLRLENQFKREIRSIFRRMVQDFRISVAGSGRPPSAERYEPQWKTALQVQYERVHRAFRGEVAAQNGRKSIQYWTGKQSEAEDLEALALMRWRDDVSQRQADLITETNDAEMLRAIDDARNSLQAEGESINPRNIAAAAMAILATRFVGRTNLIAQTETQAAAEATKQIEAEIIAGTTPFPLRGFEPGPVFLDDAPQQREVVKIWDTVGDNRVRPSHVAVDGTTLSVDGIFTLITGSKLRFAGDMLLGASIADLANCRCSTRYEG